MPDHFHALVESTKGDCDFREFMQRLRRRSSAASWQLLKGGLWQDGWHERVLRETEGTDEVIDYILLNPVRAGLAENAAEYPYSWSQRT